MRDVHRSNVEVSHFGLHCDPLSSKEGSDISICAQNECVALNVTLKKMHKLLMKIQIKLTFLGPVEQSKLT